MMLCATIASACGPFYNDISYPLTFHFYQEENRSILSNIQYEYNIRDWQRLSSGNISLEDIESAVYKYTLHSLQEEFDGKSNNAFINWIKNNNVFYIKDFLLLAKEVEELREQINSPWYYPSHKAEYVKPDDAEGRLNNLLLICKANANSPLADKYALQAIRILRALNRPSDGLHYYSQTLSRLPNDNLMKQMSQGYVAGFYMNLGDTIRADKMFALAGDFNSLSSPTADNISRLAFYNPESDVLKYRLNGFIGYEGKTRNIKMLKIADTALRSPNVIHRADWLYLKAFVEGVYNKNWPKAELLSAQALGNHFSDKRMADDARFFNICAASRNGNLKNIDKELCWIMRDYPAYRQGLLFFIIPALISDNQTAKALLVANTMDVDEPYASTGFQFLMSCTPENIIEYKHKLFEAKGLFGKLKNAVRHDDDYLNDIIGTLYMRKGQYSKAVEYLEKVSEQYQQSTNLYKWGYLVYNPWDYGYIPESKWKHDWVKIQDDYDWDFGYRPIVNEDRFTKLSTQINAKLNFATEMAQLQNKMRNAKDSDMRNLAKLRYAIGRYNSFNTCWALTQYWCGYTNQCNYQPFYYDNDGVIDLAYIIDTPKEMEHIEDWFLKEITGAITAMKTDAAKATANMMLRNYRTIAKHYPDSPEGKFLATHCDRWSDWL